jgi:hypothetical protein
MVDRSGLPVGPTTPSLPPFACVSSVSIDGQDLILMLRQGKPIKIEKRGNELVPKFALDLLGLGEVRDGRPTCWWHLNVDTLDSSGYIAMAGGSNTSAQIGQSVLVIGCGNHGIIKKAELDGTTKIDFQTEGRLEARVDALDIRSLEWRGTSIHNSWLLGADLKQAVFVPSSTDSTCSYLVTSDSKDELRLLCLHNVGAIGSCFTKKIEAKKILSKKNTLSYQIERARQETVRPTRECAFCHILEGPNEKFACCARCRRPFYCSRKCQRQHWKTGGHKQDCAKPTSEDSDPVESQG